ncbi:thiamine-phosphate kinase [Sneathiella aquimaris]|uniref:thiamine-phosphate kinase n=1 Tax=Sneathiella aquimaris TaxID=2599305 RepID=UPI00146A3B76|nr:thiamine-phosphate kinase [Sneathiella aquimaris]
MPGPDTKTGEFGIIETIFSPLTRNTPGALGLGDDAALLSVRDGHELVLTKDAMVAGVHFFENDPPADIARKLLRTNLSDLAAMGAQPVGYLLATAWTEDCDEAFIKSFAAGLEEDQALFGVGLLGGDTVKTSGPLTLSLTALGEVPIGQALRRNGAKVGDQLYVSGTIGDGALGLQARQGKLPFLNEQDRQFLERRYRLPDPKITLGAVLRDHASACLDISDGLLADAGHICKQSGVGMTIHQACIPLSDAAQKVVETYPDQWTAILSGGDDYELCFTIPPASVPAFEEINHKLGLHVTSIGMITEGESPVLLDSDGQRIEHNCAGWTHF